MSKDDDNKKLEKKVRQALKSKAVEVRTSKDALERIRDKIKRKNEGKK